MQGGRWVRTRRQPVSSRRRNAIKSLRQAPQGGSSGDLETLSCKFWPAMGGRRAAFTQIAVRRVVSESNATLVPLS
jgi:hypothetical protein